MGGAPRLSEGANKGVGSVGCCCCCGGGGGGGCVQGGF